MTAVRRSSTEAQVLRHVFMSEVHAESFARHCRTGPPARYWRCALIAGCALLALLLLIAGPASAQIERSDTLQVQKSLGTADWCLAMAKGLALGASLPRTKERLHAGAHLTVVALGSSSTSGFWLPKDKAFPAVTRRELLKLNPGASIEVLNKGVIMEDIRATRERIASDVLPFGPQLVIWQLGTNDVVWRGIADNAKQLVRAGVRELKAAGADVVLMDLQYAPMVTMWPRHKDMERIIAEVAREEQVGYFRRFTLLQRAANAGVKDLFAWDGLHSSAAGQECVGRALAKMIAAAAPQFGAKHRSQANPVHQGVQ
jgi:acyl-CoA thioesterase I